MTVWSLWVEESQGFLHSQMLSWLNSLNSKEFHPLDGDFFSSSTGVELRASGLLGRCSTTWVNPPVLFALVICQIESCEGFFSPN
jgi:hypothetical protein